MGTRHRTTITDIEKGRGQPIMPPIILREAQGDREQPDPELLGYLAAREVAIDHLADGTQEEERTWKDRYQEAVDAVNTRKEQLGLGDPEPYPIRKIQ